MEVDEASPSPPQPPAWKQNRAAVAVDASSGPLSGAAARLSARSRALPASLDFHFYNNFPSFKSPVGAAASKCDSSLAAIAASGILSKQQPPFPQDDLDDAHDRLVEINDDLLERFGASMDEFRTLREKEEAAGRKAAPEEMAGDGFQVVYGKKKKRAIGDGGGRGGGKGEAFLGSGSVTMVTRDKVAAMGTKAKVPFHIPTIPRPQDEYNIVVNNRNEPFEHVLLERSDDGARAVHPLEKISIEQLIDRNIPESEPVKPPALEDTPFTLVEDPKALEGLVAKLEHATEFAVDLEHNHYRSFQGLTCLMQISTRTEDFIVDTLKLRKHLGDYLRELFKDPTKRKVMHGADRDILWLQRDFGIYVCNLFDTGQASRVLLMERNSLEYLLHHFCGVTANKEYQSADWRLRPLPDEMIKYATEDTHYLLYMYDLMKLRLIKESTGENDLLLEVHKRSNEICLQLYEKEQLTDSSYLYIHGLQENILNANQIAILSGLYRWRDGVARAEDESTGYILPNKTLIEIAKQMPMTAGKLKSLMKSKNPFVKRYLGSIITIIRSAVENSSAFKSIAEQLKKRRLEELTLESMKNCVEDTEMFPSVGADNNESNFNPVDESAVAPVATTSIGAASHNTWSIGNIQLENRKAVISISETRSSGTLSILTGSMDKEMMSNGGQQRVTKATVQVLKRPTAFGALLGNSASGRKSNLFGGFSSEQSKNKVEKIKSSVMLPFHHFSGGAKPPVTSLPMESLHLEPESIQHSGNDPTSSTQMEEVIQLDNETDDPPPPENCDEDGGIHHEPQDKEMSTSPSELLSGFEQNFPSLNERRNPQPNHKTHQEPEFNYQLKAFDYAAARQNITFGETKTKVSKRGDEAQPSKDSGDKQRKLNQPQDREKEGNFQNPRRRQAFPPSGNRSTTYH